MKVNQNLLYIRIAMRNGFAVRIVSRLTRAAEDVDLKVGDVVSGTKAAISQMVIVDNELTANDFKMWRLEQYLSVDNFARLYGIEVKTVLAYEGQKVTA
jgi:DNA-binding transcriptional regulator YiaG